ncbi:hypothetical protein, partial [Salinivibrio sp. VYel6]|uniref:hypothetical protein n=1 Tax=Salinivibrio sp. VYel6 TaxID=2490493 RepID=UPI001C12BC10
MSALNSGLDINTIVSDFLLPHVDAHDITNGDKITANTLWYLLKAETIPEALAALESFKIEGYPCIETHVGTFI